MQLEPVGDAFQRVKTVVENSVLLSLGTFKLDEILLVHSPWFKDGFRKSLFLILIFFHQKLIKISFLTLFLPLK